MTRDEALAQLPGVHRTILEWLADGYDHDAIAARLELDRTAVAGLVVVAHRKLDRLIDQPTEPTQGESNGT